MDRVLWGIWRFRQFQFSVSDSFFFMYQSRVNNLPRRSSSGSSFVQHVSQVIKNSSHSSSISRLFEFANSLGHCQCLSWICVLVPGNQDFRREAEDCAYSFAFELVATCFLSRLHMFVVEFNSKPQGKATSKTTFETVVHPCGFVLWNCLCSIALRCHFKK